MTAPIGHAYIEILPDMRRFASGVKASVAESTAAAKGSLEELNGAAAASAGTVAHETEGLFSHIKDSIKEAAAFAIPTIGGVEAVKFIKESVDAARQEQKQLAQTAAVIKSTGGVAHVTAGQVEEMAKSLSMQTGVTQTSIRSNENLLLTFTNIRNTVGKGNDIFDQATKSVLDMSAALGENSRSAAIQLGKALNDPIKGATALRRVGVQLTDQQQAQIKAMVQGGQVAALNAEGMKITQSQLDALATKYHGTGAAIEFLTRKFTPAQKAQFQYYEQGNHLADAQKLILGELTREFGGSAAAQATAGEKASAAFEAFRVEIGSKLLPVIDSMETFFAQKLLPALTDVMDEASHGKGILAALGSIFSALYTIIQPFVSLILGLAKRAWGALVVVLQQVGPLLQRVAGFIRDNADTIRTFAVALVAIVAAWKSYLLIVRLVAVAQAALDAEFAINPLTIIAVALAGLITLLVEAWKHSETFRDIVRGVWNVIKVSALALWNALKTVFHALQTAWGVLWTGIKWAWTNVGRPIWEIIKVAAKVMYAIIGGIFLLWINSWKALWAAVQWAWQNIGKPLWQGIQAAAQFLWRNVLRPVFGFISGAWQDLWAGIRVVWRNIGQPIYDVIKGAIQALWHFVGPIFRSIGNAWSVLWNGMKSAFSSIWNGIESAIAAGINGIIHVINFFIRGIDWILDKLPGGLHINTIQTVSFGGGGGGSAPTGQGQSGKVLHNARGTGGRGLPDGWFTTGEEGGSRGWELGYKRGPHVEIYSNRDAKRMTGWDRVPGYAGGTTSLPPNQVIGGHLGTSGTISATGGILGTIAGAIGKAPAMAVALIREGAAAALRAALNAAESPVRAEIGALPDGILHRVAQGGFNTVDKDVRDLIDKLGGKARKSTAARRVGPIPAGQHLALIMQALVLAGQIPTLSNIADVNTIISYESGWNPNAINLTDSNAAAGDPSRGLMQTIMTTFEAYRLRSLSNNIYDPISNIVAGIRYAVSRYGSLGNVPGIVSIAHGGQYQGYASGAWDIPHDHTARVHQGEMILPRNLARYIRELVTGSRHVVQRDVPSASFSKSMHNEAVAQNASLRSVSETLKGVWKTFVKAAQDSQSKWSDFRQVFKGMIHDLDLQGRALERVQRLEDRIGNIYRRRAAAVRELGVAQAALNRLQSAYNSQVSSIRGTIQGGFDVTTAGGNATDRFGNPAAISSGTIAGQLASTLARARAFTAVIRKLIKEGLPRPFVTQLAMAGPAAYAQAEALTHATPKQLLQLRSDYAALTDTGTQLGKITGNYNYGAGISSREDEIARLEKTIRQDDHKMVLAFRDALRGMEFAFDGTKVTLVVSQHQQHTRARGPRR